MLLNIVMNPFKFTNLGRISSEVLNVLLDPLQSQVLIPEAHVSGYDVIASGHEAQGSESVVDGHKNLFKNLLCIQASKLPNFPSIKPN